MKSKTLSSKITIDAAGQSLGRVASQIAQVLSGKNRPSYQPNKLSGQMVEVINASKIKLTAAKLYQKKYFHFSGYPGGLKTTYLSELWAKDPASVLRRTVLRMVPRNRLRKEKMKTLTINN